MAFMVPEYFHGFAAITDEGAVPFEFYSEEDHGPMTEKAHGWFCRLSAPGYMDCTDWTGPFEKRGEAEDAIREDFDVDPETGDDLPEE